MNIIYTKASVERDERYRIITSIVDDGGKRVVIKRPTSNKSYQHLDNMYNNYVNYKDNKYISQKLEWCKCEKVDNDIVFDYIVGKSYEEILNNYYNNNYIKAIEETIKILVDYIYNIDEVLDFSASSRFFELFGSVNFDKKVKGAVNINIDMLPDNIICSGDKDYIIDYEWVIDCIVPIDFVLYRCLTHSNVINKMGNEFIEKILTQNNISNNDIEQYKKMEINFQQHVKGSTKTLDEIYKIMPQSCFKLDALDWNATKNYVEVAIKDKDTEVTLYKGFENAEGYKIEFDLDVANDSELIIWPFGGTGILRILEISGVNESTGERIPLKKLSDNADLYINDEYYFINRPKMIFDINDSSKVIISVQVIERNNKYMDAIVENMKSKIVVEVKNESIIKRIKNKIKRLLNE